MEMPRRRLDNNGRLKRESADILVIIFLPNGADAVDIFDLAPCAIGFIDHHINACTKVVLASQSSQRRRMDDAWSDAQFSVALFGKGLKTKFTFAGVDQL